MKIARLAVLGIALTAGIAAAYLMNGSKASAPATQAVAPQPVIETDNVLVAAHALDIGAPIGQGDIKWQPWPKSDLADGMILKSADPKAVDEVSGSVSRGAFFAGEPMRREKMIKGTNSGYLSAILPSGYRAVAINIEVSGGASAGGFILPNDRVDVIRTFRDEAASKAAGSEVYRSEIILTNVLVLAIGTNVQEKNGDHVVQGATATLEVDPKQAEQVILAQRVGQISLALRSLADAGQTGNTVDAPDDSSVTIIRNGVAVRTAGQ
jgi:pilus assembly protein CpaB